MGSSIEGPSSGDGYGRSKVQVERSLCQFQKTTALFQKWTALITFRDR